MELLAEESKKKARAKVDLLCFVFSCPISDTVYASVRANASEIDVALRMQARSKDAFLEDLTEYLNSTDYLVAFLGDSLNTVLAAR